MWIKFYALDDNNENKKLQAYLDRLCDPEKKPVLYKKVLEGRY